MKETITFDASPRPQNAKRLMRVLRILHCIRDEPSQWTRKRLAQSFGVSERQIDNDIGLLRAADIGIRHHVTGYEIVHEDAP